MGKRSSGTRSQSPTMMAQSRTMSMSSIGGNKKEIVNGTKSYGVKLGGRDLKAEVKNGVIEKIPEYFYMPRNDQARLHNIMSQVLGKTLNKEKFDRVESFFMGTYDGTGVRIISQYNYRNKTILGVDQYGNVDYSKGKLDKLEFSKDSINPKVFSKVLDESLKLLKNPYNGDLKHKDKWKI